MPDEVNGPSPSNRDRGYTQHVESGGTVHLVWSGGTVQHVESGGTVHLVCSGGTVQRVEAGGTVQHVEAGGRIIQDDRPHPAKLKRPRKETGKRTGKRTGCPKSTAGGEKKPKSQKSRQQPE